MTENPIYDAVGLALTAHEGQMYNNYPYSEHLRMVVDNVKKMGYGEQYIIVAWLHDTIEDTGLSIETIRNMFGHRICEAVLAITRRTFSDGTKEPHEEYLLRVANNDIARVVKWADSCANLLMCRSVECPPDKQVLTYKYLRTLDVI